MMRHLVLAHGLNNTPIIWEPLLTSLQPRLGPGWQIHCPMLEAHDTTDAVAAQLLAQLPERFSFVGFSFGGYVGMGVLAAATSRVEAFALACSSTRGENEAAVPMRQKAIEIAQGGGYLAMMTKNHPMTVHPDRVDDPAIHERRKRMLDGYGPDRFVAHMRACISRPDRTALLANFGGPRLMITAEQDKVVPAALMREIQAEMPQVPLVAIDHCGHLLPLENPPAMAEALAKWLDA
jgi:pimeloyl-ACP methyl ester carboxylesterase